MIVSFAFKKVLNSLRPCNGNFVVVYYIRIYAFNDTHFLMTGINYFLYTQIYSRRTTSTSSTTSAKILQLLENILCNTRYYNSVYIWRYSQWRHSEKKRRWIKRFVAFKVIHFLFCCVQNKHNKCNQLFDESSVQLLNKNKSMIELDNVVVIQHSMHSSNSSSASQQLADSSRLFTQR